MNKKRGAPDLGACIMVWFNERQGRKEWLTFQKHVINAQIKALIVQRAARMSVYAKRVMNKGANQSSFECLCTLGDK